MAPERPIDEQKELRRSVKITTLYTARCFRQETLSMKPFHLAPGSEGPRREFKIALGLRAGYGSAGRIYDLEEAVRTAHRWMWERAARGAPFLSGMFTRGEVVYADSGGEAASHREPVAIFAGEVLPQYAGDLEDGTVRELLNELAAEMGRTLEQNEVHIAYGDRTWTLKAE
jgi:hypothetical protein